MKNILVTILLVISLLSNVHAQTYTEINEYDAKGLITKKTILQGETEPTQLKGVTFGIGMGWNRLFENPTEYFLTPDADHKLQLQELRKSSIVLSSMITIKLGKIGVPAPGSKNKGLVSMKAKNTKDGIIKYDKPEWYEHFAVNLSLNLAELNGGDITFNKSIDGGIGLGYYINEFTQIALFFEMVRVRQMRDYIVKNYEDQSIPNGASEVYNALDLNDNNLFYNKYYSGLSVKVVFSLGNK